MFHPSFSDELIKMAQAHSKKLRKVSGEEMMDRNAFVQQLGDADKTQNRGPHPSLNYEHSKLASHPALRLEQSVFKVAAKEDSNKGVDWKRGALMAGAGIAAGAGAYGLARRIRLSNNPALREIQEKAKGRLTHIDALDTPKKSSWLKKLHKKTLRGVDDIIEETPRKWEPSYIANEGRVSVGKAPQKIDLPQKKRVHGATMSMGYPSQSRHYKADLPLSGRVNDINSLQNKVLEAEYFKAAPGAMPGTAPLRANVDRALALHPEDKTQALQALQADLKKQYPGGYVVKPSGGFDAGSGGVPTHKQNFSDIHAGQGDPLHQEWMNRMLKKPDEFLSQEYMDLPKRKAFLSNPPIQAGDSAGRGLKFNKEVPDEWRIHSVGGQVVPGATRHRWAMSHMNPFERGNIKEMEQQIQGHLNKLPDNRKGIPMALDAAKDARTGKWRVIESNPGGESGFLVPDQTGAMVGGLAPHAVYKTITGRSSKPMALAKGVGVGAAGVGGAAYATRPVAKERRPA